jgi:NIMA (never in mitosis gene a)-related kinase 1/4/5
MDIFHRDLKSANVFLYHNNPSDDIDVFDTKDEGVHEMAKLGDLNVSKVAKEGMLYTQTGTPYYASPEVWKDLPYDSKSDIWSLGCVVYEICALVPPFRAENMDGLYKRVLKG